MTFIIVGLGFWGQTWTKVLEQHAQARVVAAVDPSEKAHDWARCYLDVVCYPVLSDALRRVEADAALIATPPSWHKGAALEALSQGKHVLIEKPGDWELVGATGRLFCRGAPDASALALVARFVIKSNDGSLE